MADGDVLLAVASPKVIAPVAAAALGGAAVMHATHVSWHDPAVTAAFACAATYFTRARPCAGAVAAAGAWVASATAAGVLAGPDHAMVWTWTALTVAGLAAARMHPAVRDARDRRAARMEWLHDADKHDLRGSHLLGYETTRLGDRRVIDVTGTGKLASAVARGGLAEQIAQDERLPLARVQVTPHPIAGRVVIMRRWLDPWAHPITHPVLAEDPEIELPVPSTIRVPQIIGQDPETGAPLTLAVYDETGAKVILVVAKRRAGKTVLGSCLRERITACPDARVWAINASKAAEDRDWAPACEHAACGPAERKAALKILQAACDLIDERGARPRNTTIFQPAAACPLIVVDIDEIDALVALAPQWVRAKLRYIASKGGSEAVALVIKGQRATADWMGGSDVRANIDTVCLGRVRSPGEVHHALGQLGLAVPDMTSYGEGRKGVWVIVDDSGDWTGGRTFDLRELTDIREIAAQRRIARAPVMAGAGPPPEPRFERPAAAPVRPGPGPVDAGPVDAEWEMNAAFARAGGGNDGDDWPPELARDVDGAFPVDLQELMAATDTKNQDTGEILDETVTAEIPDVDPGQLAATRAQRWRDLGMATEIPSAIIRDLIALLAGDGTTTNTVASTFGVSKWTARCWLERLRQEGMAGDPGKGRGARWRLTGVTDSDDGADE